VIAPSEEPQDRRPADPLAGGTPAASAPAGSDPASSDPASSDPAGGTGAGDPGVEADAAERVIFFSDAVVAIAITLLALALPVPAGFQDMANRQFLHALGDDRRDYYSFLISFVVIGNHWLAHRGIFRYVDRLNRKVTAPNMVWLLMMILTPFATRVLTGLGAFGVRFTLYALIQVIASACLLVMSREIARGGLLRPGAPESARHPDHAASLAVIVGFLASIPVAFFSAWAFALWGAVPFIARVLRRLLGSRRRATSSPDRRPVARSGR
jgi:uncharacterized membrane protein